MLIVHPQMGLYAGAETVVVHLARYLNSHGSPTTILTLSSKPHPEYEGLEIITPSNSQIEYRMRGGKLSHIAEIMKMALEIKKHVRKHVEGFDIVNPHNFPSVWAMSKATPVVWMCNEVPDLWHLIPDQHAGVINRIADVGRAFDKRIVNRKVDEAVVSDEGNAEIFLKRYGWYPRIIHYGIEGEIFGENPSKIEETAVREKFNLDNHSFYIIQVGMISPSKNQFKTLKAVHQLKNKIPELKVIFAGYREEGNSYTKILDAYIRESNLASKVLFTGHISKIELRTLYQVSHLAVFSGGWQGSWLSPFEALSAEKPVITSPSIICSSLMAKENIGIVSDNLPNTIFEVYQNYSRYLEMAQRGKAFVLQNLTWKNFCENFLKVLEGVAL